MSYRYRATAEIDFKARDCTVEKHLNEESVTFFVPALDVTCTLSFEGRTFREGQYILVVG